MSSFQNRIRAVMLFGVVLMLLKLLLTGDIQYFIAPKMLKFTYFTLLTFIVICLVHFFEILSDSKADCFCGIHHKNTISLSLILLISLPIVTGNLFSNHVIGSSVAAKRGITYSENIVKKQAKKVESNQHQNREKINEIVVEDSMYGHFILDVQDNLDQYVGAKITYKGFVYRDKETKHNQVYVSRFAITCCVADAQVFGIMSEGEMTKSLKNDQWVKVTGIIEKVKKGKYYLPLIKLENVEAVKPLAEPYVYFD